MLKPFTLLISLLAVVNFSFANNNIKITEPVANASLIGVSNSSAFFNITNNGNKDVILVGVETKVSKYTELHEMLVKDGVMKMRAMPELVIPAGQTVKLTSGGKHLMLLNLNDALKAGQKFTGTLKFKDGTTQQVTFTVKSRY